MTIKQIIACENWFFVPLESINQQGRGVNMTGAAGEVENLPGALRIAAWGLTEAGEGGQEGQVVGLVAVTGGGNDTVMPGICHLVQVPSRFQGRYVYQERGIDSPPTNPDGTANELKRILDHLKKDCSHAALVDFVLNPVGNRQNSELDGHQYEWLDQHTGSSGDDHYGTISFQMGMVYAVFEYNC